MQVVSLCPMGPPAAYGRCTPVVEVEMAAGCSGSRAPVSARGQRTFKMKVRSGMLPTLAVSAWQDKSAAARRVLRGGAWNAGAQVTWLLWVRCG